jgi:thiamine biosynthesis protein ThiI
VPRVLLVHHAEIGTKGRNRGLFERRLLDDVRRALGPLLVDGRVDASRIIGRLADGAAEAHVEAAMGRVFGVAWWAIADEVPAAHDAIRAAGVAAADRARAGGTRTFAVRCRRAEKTFPMTSLEVERDLGAEIVARTGLAVDLDAPGVEVRVEILRSSALVFAGRRPGLRGLPRGGGRVVCLFSGGIDSPVAAWRLGRRGVTVDLLHLHPFPRGTDVAGTKIFNLHDVLLRFDPAGRLYLAPTHVFEARTLGAPAGLAAVLFRRFLLILAGRLARRTGARAVATGDSLGQVASQTLANIAAAEPAAGETPPVLRPLIAAEKNEIVAEAERIGAYEASIRPYKDCCALLARRPRTSAPRRLIDRLAAEISLDRIVDETLDLLEVRAGGAVRPAFAAASAPSAVEA